MGKKAIAIAAVTSLALAGCAQASAEPAATKKEGNPTAADPTGPQAKKTAKGALDRFFTYVSTLRSTSELTKVNVEQGMDIAFGKDEEGDFYRSPGLGGGWTYVIRHHDPRGPWKPGITFGFVNPDSSADPTLICVATLEQLRPSFASRGFFEVITPGEIGQVVAWNFVKNDMVFTVTPYDLTTKPDGTECVLVIHTTDG
jgi:hypothetical protein